MAERHMATVEIDIEIDISDMFGVVPVVDGVVRGSGLPALLAEAGATVTRLSYNAIELPGARE